jgi:ubiquinone/menaquinone biosynthesis C-methylase UbiE
MGSERMSQFRKDLSNLDWATVFERQAQRAVLVPVWLDALEVHAGSHVLDLGAGPGYVSVQAAQRVGSTGMVYAIDRSADALDFLAELQHMQGIAQIRRIVADAATMAPLSDHIDAALVTMLLHHCEDPAALLRNVSRLLPVGARAVVAEFDPRGQCLVGPPRQERLEPDQVRAWCEAAGLQVLWDRRQPPEYYTLLVARGSMNKGS